MNLAASVISRWQLTMVLFTLLAALGLNAFFSISRAVDPHFPIPVVFVIATLPGADATEMEETVAKPIEDILQGLDDVNKVQSTNSDGSSVINVEFDWKGDADQYFNDAVREVSAIRNQLPPGLTNLEFRRVRTTESAIMQLALVSDSASWLRMEKYSEDLSDILNRNVGVRAVRIHGLPQNEVSVVVDAGKLSELRIPMTEVADILQQGAAEIPGGSVQSGIRRFNIDAGGAYEDLDAIKGLPLRSINGSVVTVDDVADVSWSTAEQRVETRHNGKRGLFITATQKDGVDVTKLRDILFDQLDIYRSTLPADMQLELQFDQSKDINFRLSELSRDFSIALFLVIFTLLPLGIRASLIVMISIPLSLSSGLFAVFLAGQNLNQLVVAGFILSLGLLVDDSIVVTENIARHLRMGKQRAVAAVEATREITPAILGSTGVLVFAFIPLLFLPEGAGAYTKSFFYSIIFTVIASMIISLTIIPFLASRILKRNEDPEGNALLQWLNRNIERFYDPLLQRALNWPKVAFYSSMAVTLSAFILLKYTGFTLFPDADASYFRVTVETEQGSSLEATRNVVSKVSAILEKEPAVITRAENIGAANPQVFYNVFSTRENTNYGEILVVLEKWGGSESNAMVERLRKKFDDIAGARIKVVLFKNGAPVNAPITIRVTGPDNDVLKDLSSKAELIMRNHPDARDVVNPVATDRIDVDLNIDEQKAALLNIAGGAPRRSIRLALNGEIAGNFRDIEGDNYPVVVRLPRGNVQPISALQNIYVGARDGTPIPLAEITQPRLKAVPAVIDRYKLERVVSLTSQNVAGSIPSQITEEILAEIDKIEKPDEYRFSVGGEAEAIADTFSGFGPAIMVAIFSIFGILVAEFGRFRETIVVIGVIPLGIFGGIIALFITGNSVSFMAVIGFIALIGIEIKNSILLVDFTSQLRDEGVKLREAIERAGRIRFLPVLLTSLTAVGGLMPLALFGGNLYGPLAIVIIGGLISSTILSRIVTPVMYLLIAKGDNIPDVQGGSDQRPNDLGNEGKLPHAAS